MSETISTKAPQHASPVAGWIRNYVVGVGPPYFLKLKAFKGDVPFPVDPTTNNDEIDHSPPSFRLLDLPDELILHVLRYLLSTGMVYHIFQRSAGVAGPPSYQRVVVHHLSRNASILNKGSNPESRHLRGSGAVEPTILRTCRRLQTLGYEILYGENQFIFEHATHEGHSRIGVFEDDRNHLFSRTRTWIPVLNTWTRAPRAYWPLSKTSVHYFRHLLVTIQIEHGPECNDLIRETRPLEELMGLFSNNRKLKSLVVDIDTKPPPFWNPAAAASRDITDIREQQGRDDWRLELAPESAAPLTMRLRNPVHADAASTHPQIWNILRKVCEDATPSRYLWDPVRRLGGGQNVVLSGCTTEWLATEVVSKIQLQPT